MQLADVRSVVAFGGGTGLGRLLASLAFLGDRLVGVVATTDNGGSTGRLRAATGCIAWGDLRHCFNQICAEPTLGRLLFEYRFGDSGDLSGHNLGNLILLALDQLTARPLDAINLVRELLDVEPRLLPMSEDPSQLLAVGSDGETVEGEVSVAEMQSVPTRLWLEPPATAPTEVLEAIATADLILLGPGSFITSIVPSLLVDAIRDAVRDAPCPRVLVANLAAEPGPVGALSLAEQLAWMDSTLGARLVDAVLWPRSQDPGIGAGGPITVHTADLADALAPMRHDAAKLAAGLAALFARLSPR